MPDICQPDKMAMREFCIAGFRPLSEINGKFGLYSAQEQNSQEILMPITRGNITVHLGPAEQGGSDSLVDPIVAFIDRAKRRQKLMIAVQEIDHMPIAAAIVRARLSAS